MYEIIIQKCEDILIQANYIAISGGFIAYTETGKALKNAIEKRLRDMLISLSVKEVEFPAVIDYERLNLPSLIRRGRKAQCFHLEMANKRDVCLIHTGEELAAQYFSDHPHKEAGIFQIKSKFRFEYTEDLLRKLEFTMMDAYCMEQNAAYPGYTSLVSGLVEVVRALGVPCKLEEMQQQDGTDIHSQELSCQLTPGFWIEVGHFYQMGKEYGTQGYFSSYGIGIDRLFSCVAIQRIKGEKDGQSIW